MMLFFIFRRIFFHGWVDFEDNINSDIKFVGGFDSLVRGTYARNLWLVMKKFNVLPSEERFQNLTTSQLNFIISSMIEDNRREELIEKGYDPNDNSDFVDSDFDMDKDMEMFDEDKQKELAEQMSKLLSPDEVKKKQEKLNDAFELAKDADAITEKQDKEASDIIAKRIEEAKRLAQSKSGIENKEPKLDFEQEDEDIDTI